MLTEFIKHLTSRDNTGHIEISNDPFLKPDDMAMVNLEQYSESRFRERYCMETSSIQAFTEYTNKREIEVEAAPITSVNPDTCTAQSIFNAKLSDGEPGHCDDTARCTLKALPMYQELMGIAAESKGVRQISQRGLIDWIRDWNEYLDNPQALIESFSKLTVERVANRSSEEGDYKAERSELEKIQVKADKNEVPDVIRLTMCPYEGFNNVTVEIGVSASTDRHDNKVVLRMRVRGFETLKLNVANEFADKLKDQLSTKPIIGTVQAV